MNIEQFDSLVTELNNKRDEIYRQLEWLTDNKLTVLSVGCNVSQGYGLTFTSPTREDTIKIMRSLGGKWDKQYYGDKIDYRQNREDLIIRIDSAPPPASCRIVTERVLVPAQFVAEHYVTRTKLQCTETSTSDDSTKLSELPEDLAPVASPPDDADTAAVTASPPDSSAPPSAELPKPVPESNETSPEPF